MHTSKNINFKRKIGRMKSKNGRVMLETPNTTTMMDTMVTKCTL